MSTFAEREKRRARNPRMGLREFLLLYAALMVALLPLIAAFKAIEKWGKRYREIEVGKVHWGEQSNGLRVGIESVGPESPEDGWKRPAFQFHMKNEGNAAITVAGVNGRWHSKGIDPSNSMKYRVTVSGRLSDETTIRQRRLVTLAPGEEIRAGEPLPVHLWFDLWGNDEPEIELRFVYGWRHATVKVVPEDGSEPSEVGMWTGRVESGAIDIVRDLPKWLQWGLTFLQWSLYFLLASLIGHYFRRRRERADEEATVAEPAVESE